MISNSSFDENTDRTVKLKRFLRVLVERKEHFSHHSQHFNERSIQVKNKQELNYPEKINRI
jgi:hypothetical protein